MQSKNEVMALIKALDTSDNPDPRRRRGLVNRFIRALWVSEADATKQPKEKAVFVPYKPTPAGTKAANTPKSGAKTAQKKH